MVHPSTDATGSGAGVTQAVCDQQGAMAVISDGVSRAPVNSGAGRRERGLGRSTHGSSSMSRILGRMATMSVHGPPSAEPVGMLEGDNTYAVATAFGRIPASVVASAASGRCVNVEDESGMPGMDADSPY